MIRIQTLVFFTIIVRRIVLVEPFNLVLGKKVQQATEATCLASRAGQKLKPLSAFSGAFVTLDWTLEVGV
jgi:hypothetical protein